MNWIDELWSSPKVVPPLDPEFRPASAIHRRFEELLALEGGGVPLRLGIERSDGAVSTFSMRVFGDSSPRAPLNLPLVERVVKFLLWQRGGWCVLVAGPVSIAEYLRNVYSPDGARAFDAEFMASVYEKPFEVRLVAHSELQDRAEAAMPLGRHLEGCRIGFDLGASDRKSSAVIDGEPVFSEEVPWDPRPQSDPEYHYNGVMDSIRRAAAHLPRVDAIGGSAAGIYIGNRVRVGSLYRGVPKPLFEERIADMFVRIGRELGVPLEVVNDGEVTALAGSMSLGENPVLGIAMGSSQAGGYVDSQGYITGWLNELAFTPIDYRLDAPADEWSGDRGCGVQYFSQVGAVRVAEGAGMDLGEGAALPAKLEALQAKMAAGDPVAVKVYETLGVYLGYAVAHYARFYALRHVLILGRVTTGEGGNILLDKANSTLQEEFPKIAEHTRMALPDEKSRRVGQSIAAASLPALPSKLDAESGVPGRG